MRIASVVHNEVHHDARVLKQARTLTSAGHEVTVFGLHPEGAVSSTTDYGFDVRLAHRDLSNVDDRMVADGLRFTAANRIRTSFREQADILFELVDRTMRPDVVHIHDHVALNAVHRYRESWNVPIIWDAHEIYEDLAGVADARAVVNPRIILEAMTTIDHFITLNRSIADFYASRYPALPEASLLPNAAEWRRQVRYDGRLHLKAGLPQAKRILLFQGGFSEHRGIPQLLQSARFLSEEWSIVFMGWGKLQATIEEHSRWIGFHPDGSAKVACIPGVPQNELSLWTSGASLGAIPYEAVGLNHEYCTPNKLWEYSLAGVPLLATRLPELEQYIEAHKIGIAVDRTLEPKDLARAVNQLSERDLEQMRTACLVFAAIDNWSTHEPTLCRIYESIERSLRRVPD